MEPLIQIRNLCKTSAPVRRRTTFRWIFTTANLSRYSVRRVAANDFAANAGRFENPDSGEIKMDGRDLTPLPPNRRPLNMCFNPMLFFRT